MLEIDEATTKYSKKIEEIRLKMYLDKTDVIELYEINPETLQMYLGDKNPRFKSCICSTCAPYSNIVINPPIN